MDALRRIQEQDILDEVKKAIDDHEIMVIAHGKSSMSFIAVRQEEWEVMNMPLSAMVHAASLSSTAVVDAKGLYKDLKDVLMKYWSDPNE